MAGPTLEDDIWTRRGVSVLWDADSLADVCTPQQVVSLRRFLQLNSLGWPKEQLPLVHDSVMVVAGLESAMDALPPDEATDWLESVVYQGNLAYQREVAYGGTERGLILWLSDRRRLTYTTADDTYYWHCATEFKGQMIPLSRCLFNGGKADARQIHSSDRSKKDPWIGLFHPKVGS